MKLKPTLLILSLSILLASCGEDKSVPTPTLTVSPTTLDLKVNETKSLTIEFSPSDLTLSLHSLNPKIATVDQQGNVTGVSAGETKVQVLASDIVRTVTVRVSAEQISTGNQLPLLLFSDDYQDPKIIAHEARVGRVDNPSVPIDPETYYLGYSNKDLTITTAVYGLQTNEGAAIIAGCKESVSLLNETKWMLEELGFDSLELLNDPVRGYYYTGKNRDGIMVVIYREDLPEYDIKSIIMFVATRFGGKGTKLHDVVPTAEDFPTFATFLYGEDSEADIKKFEGELNLRELDPSAPEGTLLFNTKPSELEKTNINMAFYVVNPPEGSSRFIRLELNCAEDIKELLELDFQQYLGTNGFGTPHYIASKDFIYADYIPDPSIYVALFVQPAQGDLPPFLLAEISKNETSESNLSCAIKSVSLSRERF